MERDGGARTELAELVADALSETTAERFAERVERQADRLREAIRAGEFDSPEFAVGLEMEVYAVDADHEALTPLPEAVFGGPVNKELGVHNAELNTDPDVFDADGLEAQADAIRASVATARERAREHDTELVLDAMWTLPPAAGSYPYLSATRDEGVAVAEHMRPDPRYVAIDHDIQAAAGGSLPFRVPGADLEFPTILFESLATSIQPHLQVPDAGAFPDYYNAAIRTLGPVLALTTNSPFLPPDLYDAADPAALVADTHHELRIAAFEDSVNHTGKPKVRVPSDIETATDVVDRVVADDLVAPFLREWLEPGERADLAAEMWEFDHKRSTYWRWLRCVVRGDPVGTGDERSLRIEYRPVPTQPTVRDVVAVQRLVAGLVRGLVAADHPLTELPRAAAEDAFYAAAREGLDADLAWVTADGRRTADTDAVFEEVFRYAGRGLREAGLDEAAVERSLAPLRARWDAGVTPSGWQKRRVRERLADGADLAAALTGTAREYVRLSLETDSFAEWL